jgi:hypothetical protein
MASQQRSRAARVTAERVATWQPVLPLIRGPAVVLLLLLQVVCCSGCVRHGGEAPSRLTLRAAAGECWQ